MAHTTYISMKADYHGRKIKSGNKIVGKKRKTDPKLSEKPQL